MSQGMYGSPTQGRETGAYGSSLSHESQSQNLVEHLTQFCRENPGTAAAWCFGIGFVLGWRLKPW